MLTLLNNLSWLEKIGLFLFAYFLCSNIISFIRYKRTTVSLGQGKIPDCLENFPVHTTTADAYLQSKNKVERFINLALTEQQTELKLSQDDLNNLYTKGIILNKYTPGKYLYYQIQDNVILEKLIEGPWYLPPVPYRTRKTEFSFSKIDLKQFSRIIEEYGKPMKGEQQSFSLSISSLILFIFGASISPDTLPLKFRKTVEYQRAMVLLKKIKSVEVNNGHLILKA